MYTGFLHLHHFIAYVLLTLLIIAAIKFIYGKYSNANFTPLDKKLAMFTMIFFHTQATLGVVLYFLSSSVRNGLSDMGMAMKEASIRFFVIEHPLMMTLAVILLTLGYSKSKKAVSSNKKFSGLAITYSIALLFTLSRVPWDKLF